MPVDVGIIQAMHAEPAQEPDTTQDYICYNCEEVIAFMGPSDDMIAASKKYGKFHDYTEDLKPKWKHVKSGSPACRPMQATPSNLVVE